MTEQWQDGIPPFPTVDIADNIVHLTWDKYKNIFIIPSLTNVLFDYLYQFIFGLKQQRTTYILTTDSGWRPPTCTFIPSIWHFPRVILMTISRTANLSLCCLIIVSSITQFLLYFDNIRHSGRRRALAATMRGGWNIWGLERGFACIWRLRYLCKTKILQRGTSLPLLSDVH